MTNPLDASFYPDAALHLPGTTVLENVRVARDTYRLRFAAAELALRIAPGQFFMVRISQCDDPLIGRPFALFDTVNSGPLDSTPTMPPDAVDFVYVVGGKMTQALARLQPGQQLDVWGPLGNGFVPRPCDHLIMVAGGIGQTPFLAVAKERLGLATYAQRGGLPLERVSLCYGARSADRLACLSDFERAGVAVQIATDDGSQGHHGLVTDLVEQLLRDDARGVHVLCCGPEPMMAATSQVAKQYGVPCDVSLEEPMACGIGICFTCVARIRDQHGDWDYRRTCVEGPVFSADRIAWSTH